MAVPDYQTLMLPLLKFLSDRREQALGEAIEVTSNEFRLTPVERQQLLPVGQRAIIRTRVGWAKTNMAKAGLIDAVRCGHFQMGSKTR